MTKENEIKKEYLKRYAVLKRKESVLELEIEEIRSRYTGQAITYSDMPHGTDQRDLSDYAAQVDELLAELMRIRDDTIKERKSIASDIDAMQDGREKDLLKLRYILCMTWEDVADQMHLDVRWVHRIDRKSTRLNSSH